jgi:hypothetical protein
MTIFKERVRIKPGGIIELAHPDLPAGEEVEVVVIVDSSVENAEAAPPPQRPIWEVALEIGSSVPDEEWAGVPGDLAKNLDHYLYGARKHEE